MRPVTISESKNPFAPATPREKKVKGTHHRRSRANSTSCRACRRRPCPPPRRRPACRRRRRRGRRRSGGASARWWWSLRCGRRRTRGLRSASCRRCSRRAADAPPRRSAHPRPTSARPAGAVRRGRCPAGQGAVAGGSGLGRWATTCPAGQSCLRQDVSMRACK